MLKAFLLYAALNYALETVIPNAGRIDGWAANEREIAVWGERILRVPLTGGKLRGVPSGGKRYTVGGAIWRDALVLNEADPPALILMRGSQRVEIAAGVVAADVLPVTLHGRRGVAVVHKRNQIRFYWEAGRKWQEREVYSFYSHSGQGGLLAADVDGDGRTDLYCGNYWVQSPRRFDLHWRLFAINLWNETGRSGMMRLAARPGRLWVAQRELADARLSLFESRPDPQQLWTENRLAESLNEPRGLTVGDLDGDGALDVAIGEAAGARRILMFSRGNVQELSRGHPVLGLHFASGSLYAVTDRSVLRFRRK